MKSIQSNGYKFSIPQFTEDGSILVKGFYNLLLARKNVAVANDIHTTGDKRVFIITGINSGGKTTFAITFGQLAFLSLIGVPIPAEEAKICLFSNIMTAFPTEEDKMEDLSRLEKDVERVHNILKTADDKTLVIVNELFSSTTSEEGFELAKRFIEKITGKGSYLVYVTFITKIATLENCYQSCDTNSRRETDFQNHRKQSSF
jgi:Mismatch repair ATPase (MutS family)